MFTKLDNPGTLPTGIGRDAKFSHDDVYLAVSHATTPFVTIYKRSGDTFTKLANPADLPSGTGHCVAWSSDDIYLAVGHDTSPYITIYKRSGDTFTKLANPEDLPTEKVDSLAWSKSNSTYLYAGQFNLYFSRGTMYKRSGDTFTEISAFKPIGFSDGEFSNDDTYFASVHRSPETRFISIYKRIGDVFTPLDDPDDLPSPICCSWSHDSIYLSMGQPDGTVFTYKRSGDTFTKLAYPAIAGEDNITDLAYSPDSTFLACVQTTAPYNIIYRRNGDVLTKFDDLFPTVNSAGNTIAFSNTGSCYIAFTQSASPYIGIYRSILTVTTQEVTDILSITATGNGTITDTGGENATRRGFCYMEGTEGDPTTADDVVYDDGDFGVGAYTKGLTGLTKGTGYRVRAYAINSAGTAYGDTVQFTTDIEPTVTTQAVSDIGDVTATGNGNITDLGGDTPTKRGICYNTTGSPTVADSKVEETGEFETGAFTETLINLSPETHYYVKAYAMNAVGYGYGAEVEFTTRLVEYIGYGEWVKFITAAPGAPGDKPSGYKNDICSDDSGFTYILNRSLTDDGASYESYFVLSTDLSGKKTLHTNKRLEDIFSYFANKGTGTAKVYIKRDTEPAWQEAGEISLTGEEEIIIKHLPVDFLAKTYLIKFVFENDFEFIGAIFEAIPIGDRP